jgi:hypothetical protein
MHIDFVNVIINFFHNIETSFIYYFIP